MRSVRPAAAEFSIVVAIVAVGTQDSGAHAAPYRRAVKVQHVSSQAGLREHAGAVVEYRVTRGRKRVELGNHIQSIAGGNRPYGEIAINTFRLFARARAMAAQAILILIAGRVDDGLAVRGADPYNLGLRRTDSGRRGEATNPIGGMRIMAVDAGNMAVLIQQHRLMGEVRTVSRRKSVTILGRDGFRKDIGGGGDVFELPLWQTTQAWSSAARSSEFPPWA